MDLMDEFQARRLVSTYADMILRISYQYLKQTYDAEDICQTVFLKYISNNMTFNSVEHEKAWIIRTAINACKDHVKSSWFKRTVALEDASAIAAPEVPNTWLLDAMKSLPEKIPDQLVPLLLRRVFRPGDCRSDGCQRKRRRTVSDQGTAEAAYDHHG